MTFEEFLDHAKSNSTPPGEWSPSLVALWHAEKGDWEEAHNTAQGIDNEEGSWIHANLHREEGDLGNSRYWYNRANRPESKKSVEEERHEIIRALLKG